MHNAQYITGSRADSELKRQFAMYSSTTHTHEAQQVIPGTCAAAAAAHGTRCHAGSLSAVSDYSPFIICLDGDEKRVGGM